jgi:nucleoside 2-deoxyribosyltransferase
MLTIAGGIYREYCTEGDWKQLFGSGLRAAAALQSTGEEIHLFSFVNTEDVPLAEATAQNSFGIKLHAANRSASIAFHYQHGLSTPVVAPPIHLLKQEEPLRVEQENVLRFGFLEGDAIVRGKTVVYDPQSAYTPQPFHANGSAAEKLAIVCNRREAVMMSGQSELEAAVKALHKSDNADVIVVKCGADGALVSYEGTIAHVSARRTARVWPIGSGDVFATWFAYGWIIQKLQPVEAAEQASRAAAYYCAHRSLPVPTPAELASTFTPPPVPRDIRGTAHKPPNVYLAGPFFTMMQRWLIEEARAALMDQGFCVFSPFHDVGFGTAEEVVPADIRALDTTDVMFAVLEGLDSGTFFELGYARAKNVPVIGFAQNVSEEAVKMLKGTNCLLCDDFVTAVYHTVWALRE